MGGSFPRKLGWGFGAKNGPGVLPTSLGGLCLLSSPLQIPKCPQPWSGWWEGWDSLQGPPRWVGFPLGTPQLCQGGVHGLAGASTRGGDTAEQGPVVALSPLCQGHPRGAGPGLGVPGGVGCPGPLPACVTCSCPSVHPTLHLSVCPALSLSIWSPSIHLSVQLSIPPPCIHLSVHPAVHSPGSPSISPWIRLSVQLSIPPCIHLSIAPCASQPVRLSVSVCPATLPALSLSVCPSPFPSVLPFCGACVRLSIPFPVPPRVPLSPRCRPPYRDAAARGQHGPARGLGPAHSAPWRPGPGCAGARPGREQKRAPPANGSAAEGSGPADWRRLDQWRGSAARPSEPTWGGGTGPERSSPDRS